MRLALVHTAVSPLGAGPDGGVGTLIIALAKELLRKGHSPTIICGEGSRPIPEMTWQIPGAFTVPAQTISRDTRLPLERTSFLARAWYELLREEKRFDAIINLSYDWFPIYLTPHFRRPVFHFLSMASLTDEMDQALVELQRRFPPECHIGMLSKTQGETFPKELQWEVVGAGVEVEAIPFSENGNGPLIWMGRITPEKRVEDVFALSELSSETIEVYGFMQSQSYWDEISRKHPSAKVTYRGFFPQSELHGYIQHAKGCLVTSDWNEAFGLVAVEAMACGVPVIAYRDGTLKETVLDGKTGFLVNPRDVAALARQVPRLSEIKRKECREHVQENYSISVFAENLLSWVEKKRAFR